MKNAPNPFNGKHPLTAFACVAILIVLIGVSCKKKTGLDVTDRLMNKWSIVQISDSVYSSTSIAPMVSNYEGKTGEYMDFRTDGKLYSYINNVYDTATYTYSAQNYKVNVRAHKYDIIILTEKGMILHEPRYSTSSGSNDYSAFKITLKR